MNLTDPEMIKIHEAAVNIHKNTGSVYPAADEQSGSFFQDREALNLYPLDIFEYSFETPLELRTALTKMWEYQQNDYMHQFVIICTVAVFKYRARGKSVQEKQEGISSFIYEF